MSEENHKTKDQIRSYTRYKLKKHLPRRCELCGVFENNLIIHHKKYCYPPKLEDCLVLCRKCHGKVHSQDEINEKRKNGNYYEDQFFEKASLFLNI